MIKKVLFVVAGVAIVGALLFGRDAISYVTTTAGCVKDSVRDSFPIEFQIERARRMLNDLEPEIKRNLHAIAEEEVELERLQKRITEAEANLDRQKENVLRLKTDLAQGKEAFTYAGREFTADEVRADLAHRFERYKTNEATLKTLHETYSARERSLTATRQKFEGTLAAKRQLEVEVENLMARQQQIAAAQTTSEYNLDDSKLARVKELISDLRTRQEVAVRLANIEGDYHEAIPLDETTPANIVEQVTDYFAGSAPSADSVAVTP